MRYKTNIRHIHVANIRHLAEVQQDIFVLIKPGAEVIDAKETECLSELILSALAEAQRRDKPLGRLKGSVKQQGQLLSDSTGRESRRMRWRTGRSY